jgi:hypothetical protein
MFMESDYMILYDEEITIVGGTVMVVYWLSMGLINIFEFFLFSLCYITLVNSAVLIPIQMS